MVGRHRFSAQLMAANLGSTDCLCGRGPGQGRSLQRLTFSDLPLTPPPQSSYTAPAGEERRTQNINLWETFCI